ncbi:glycosyl transferase family 4 [Trinickia symbiotica]|uniref:Glycosyltransferase family 1 protein n=1 Tax=Trinickia symbiotica TaxID=863227 RepID=A0A2N7X083_9BURK|nr:glycosyltransferase family 1 protein [Trinickia symbiotica]PMS35037.1 glycosyltransferase family 1 protein [Trinickia symbiotica]PPK43536.1 glycosyl transferase family 4 [Trinickia symbiotica]
MDFAINGKFTAQRITGVQRVAYELTRAMQLLDLHSNDIEIVVPRNATEPGASLLSKRCCPWFMGNVWEQIALPLTTSGETLISLCNTSPLIKRRQIVMVHDMAIFDVPYAFSKKFRLWYKLVFATIHRNAKVILTVSEFSKERICRHLNVDPSRVFVINPGIDHMERVHSDRSVLARLELATAPYCLLVGSLDPRKNLRRALAAVEHLGHLSEVKFVVVGGKNSRVFGEQTPTSTAENRQVVWAGFVTDSELKALYENARLLAFPSLYEGFGLPPLEAMYCGCPAVVSREASLPEACGDAALYCDATSVDDIADKMAQMLGDDSLRARYRQLGLMQARKYRWERAARQLMNVLGGNQLGGSAHGCAEPARPR